MPQGLGNATVGDMPHNWASAEFIRLVRDLIALERGDRLELLQGVPDTWFIPGADLSLKQMASEFGKIDFSLKVSEDGRTATIALGSLGHAGDPGFPEIHLEGLKRLGFKSSQGDVLPDTVSGSWGKDFRLSLAK